MWNPGIECMPAEVPSDNDNDDDMMDQIDSQTLKIMESTQFNQIDVDKPAITVPKTVIMYNCKM